MPTASPRPCSTCGRMDCTTHRRQAWRRQTLPEPPRIRGRKLQRLRQRLFDKDPYCILCRAQGRTRLATIRDHIVPLGEGGQDIEANTQGLCQWCSDEKTHAEATRGIRRNR